MARTEKQQGKKATLKTKAAKARPKARESGGKTPPPEPKPRRYYEAVGRRKTAIARVRIAEADKQSFVVNEKPLHDYFQEKEYQRVALESLEKGIPGKSFLLSVNVRGGGIHAQAEAVRQGVARAIMKFDGQLRPTLKALGFLTRDARMRERKKFGLKRARRARQWRKR